MHRLFQSISQVIAMTHLRILTHALAAALAIALSIPAASSEADPLQAAVTTLGNINGRALACGHAEVVSRAKAIVIARVVKTRELGEAFEKATSDAFLAQVQRKAECPPRAALTVELEVTARLLNPPNAHQLAATPETPEVGINPRYLLQATNGRAVMDGDFKDRFQLIAFGYTFCPDICPTTLLEMAAVLKQLGDAASKVQALFISVDPERDTLAQLHTYTSFFDPRILGATGAPELVRRAADNFKVRYEKVIDPKVDPAHYAVDHSAGMFLLSPGGQFLTKFAYGKPVDEIVARLREEIARRVPADGQPMQGVSK
jgi:protein SCO1